jgi:hypothetical protein
MLFFDKIFHDIAPLFYVVAFVMGNNLGTGSVGNFTVGPLSPYKVDGTLQTTVHGWLKLFRVPVRNRFLGTVGTVKGNVFTQLLQDTIRAGSFSVDIFSGLRCITHCQDSLCIV